MIQRLVVLAALALLLTGCAPETERSWQEAEGYRWAALSVSGRGAGFTRLAATRTGVGFSNTLSDESVLANRHTMNGSGVAVGDVDGDGWADLYFVRLDGSNILYRNLGNWRFEDITETAGVAAPDRYATGAVLADVDGDGDLDLLVTALGGPDAMFLNDGSGRFTEITAETGRTARRGSTTMALADVDGDGDLDLYVATYKVKSINDLYPPPYRVFERTVIRDGDAFKIAPEFEAHYVLRIQDDKLIRLEYAEPDQFYLNDGTGRFIPVAFTEGAILNADGTPLAETPTNWALTARFQDVNGDGVPDLYVCNDFESPDFFWLGDGDGRFRAVDALALRKTSLSTMSVDFSDIDRDGDLDLFTTDMLSRDYARRQTQVGLTLPMPTHIGEIENRPQAVQNMLFLNRSDGTYAETASMAGVAASEWSWSGLFLDVDVDGYEDILVTTGHRFDVQDADAQQLELRKTAMLRDPEQYRQLILDFPDLYLNNIAFRNRGDGTFQEMPDGWGFGDEPDVSQGLAFGDLDHDGDLDAVVNRLNRVAGVYRNDASAPRLAVRLRGAAPNTQGIGARIYVSGGPVEQVKEVISGGQYLSGSDPIYAFATGDENTPLRITVHWRSGRRSVIENAQANRIYEIDEPTAAVPESATPSQTEVSALFFEERPFRHSHDETPFEDFDRHPLLPWALSRLGPAVAWADLDGDSDDDLLLGSGRGGRLAAYRNDGTGTFEAIAVSEPEDKPAGDIAGIVAMPHRDGARVFVGASNYEGTPRDASWIDVYEMTPSGRLQPLDRLPFGISSVGPLALADVDGDDDLDLFAGGRVMPGRYPETPTSRLYRNEAGRFTYDQTLSTAFAEAGMVSGATFGDLDGDGDADLLLAIAWGPLRYFENDGAGRFTDRTAETGLEDYTGRWNGVALGDFNTDGLLDVVATNWGWNTRHGRLDGATEPLRLYYGDFDANGVTDPLETHYEASLGGYVPDRGLSTLSFALPYVRERMQTHHRFATATVPAIIGPKLDRAPFLNAATLSHVVLLNKADGRERPRFEAKALPAEAQRAPALALAVADYDGDGYDDVFLSQNVFGLPMDTPRLDAGRGLWLRGDGGGGFEAVSGTETGIKVYGEQRGAAVADVDADGRIDLVVSQNGTATKLYRNTQAPPGLRVRLVGPPENGAAIGTVVQIRYEDGTRGPARIVTAGSGYWSQSSGVPVLGRDATQRATGIVVQWPGGAVTETVIPEDVLEITVQYDDEY